MKTFTFILASVLLSGNLFSQDLVEKKKDCSEFYQESCFEVRESFKNDDKESTINDRDMKMDTQSKSSLFSKGDTAILKMRAYADQEYRLTFCAEEIFGGESVEYKIYERKRELIDWKSYDDSVRTVELEQYKQDSIRQDSIYQASLETEDEYDYYDNYDESDDYYNGFSNSYSEEGSLENTSKKRPKFKVVKSLVYDNSKDNMTPTVSFPARETMSLIIEIMVPGEAPANSFKLEERGCVGVLIEHTIISDTGF